MKFDDDNYEIISLFSILKICFDPSLEPSRRDGSNEGSRHMHNCLSTDKALGAG